MQKTAFITTCSARKKKNGIKPVSATKLAPGPQNDILKNWQNLIADSPHSTPVWDIYAGRSICEMKRLSRSNNAPLFIISAGLGLIESSEEKPVYDLTVSGKGSSSVTSKVTNDKFSPKDWWTGINRGKKSPISNTIHKFQGTLFVVALSSQYYDLVKHDLESISLETLQRVRIVGIRPQPKSILAPSILPYDDRLNGPDSPIPGTLSDFPQRCAVHYMNHIHLTGDRIDDSSMVAQCMNSLTWPVRTTGERIDDEKLIRIIADAIQETGLPKTRLLKHLRHNLKVACEQKRFASLYNMAAKGIADGKNN